MSILKWILSGGHHGSGGGYGSGGHGSGHHGSKHGGSHGGGSHGYNPQGGSSHNSPYGYQTPPPSIAQNTLACGKCNTANPAQSKFCHQCGNSLLPTICNQCQNIVPPSSKFCPQCGNTCG